MFSFLAGFASMKSPSKALDLGILAICINLLLMLVKIGVGLLGNSYALVADGIESASDIFSSLIKRPGFQFSLSPADDNHPCGHGRMKTLAGMFAGFALLGAAGVIACNAVKEIRTSHHAPAWFTLPVMIGAFAVKEFLSRGVFAAGDSLDSNALKGAAWCHRSDAITSGACAIGLCGYPRAGRPPDFRLRRARNQPPGEGSSARRKSTHPGSEHPHRTGLRFAKKPDAAHAAEELIEVIKHYPR